MIGRSVSNPDFHPLLERRKLDVHIGSLKSVFVLSDREKGRVDILVGLRGLLKTEEIVKGESNENVLKGVVRGMGLLFVQNVLWLGNEVQPSTAHRSISILYLIKNKKFYLFSKSVT